MKIETKIAILNFVLKVLGLTTEKTGLVTRQGKKLGVKTFSYKHSSDTIDMDKETTLNLILSAKKGVNEGLIPFIHRHKCVDYKLENTKKFRHCKAEVIILKVL